MSIADRLANGTATARIGLGLAAVGRPGYINLGHHTDLPSERSVEALRDRAHELLDLAYASGVRYLDAARSYGRAEQFLADWLRRRDDVADVVVGSKWGYTYTADWQVAAEVHEVKDHSATTFERQLGETRELLGDRLDLYQIHSLTLDSPALTDRTLHSGLAGLAAQGVTIGLTTSGPAQGDTIRAALKITVDGAPLFRSVQATWNVLEQSAGGALAEAREAGCLVIIKEAMANGRLAGHEQTPAATALATVAEEVGSTMDAVAIAAVLHQPWVSVVLSGAATAEHLRSNLAAATLSLSPEQLARITDIAEPADQYWRNRSRLAWT